MSFSIVFVCLSIVVSVGNTAERYTGPIIDMHLHSYTNDDYWGPAPNPLTGQMSSGNADEHRRQCLALIKKHNIVLAVVDGSSPMALDTWKEALGEGIIRGFRFDNPAKEARPDSFLSWVNRGEIELLGEIGSTYAGLSPADTSFDPYWEICQRFNIPVGIHTGGSFPGIHLQIPTFRLRMGDPFLVEDILAKYPGLRLYLMHAGAHFYERAAILMVQYPTLYVDIAVLNWVPDASNFLVPFLRRAKEYKVLDRVMYGSDEMIWPEAIEMAIEKIQSLDMLTLEEKEGIFYSNAARFLDLSQETISRHHVGQRK